MNTLKTLSKLFLILLFYLTAISCSSDDDNDTVDTGSGSKVDLTEAYIRLFGFEETYVLEVKTDHPSLHNDEEVEKGQMRIKIPEEYPGLRLTTKASDFNHSLFTISPELGEIEDFSRGKITYTITSKKDPSKKIHYDILVTKDEIQ